MHFTERIRFFLHPIPAAAIALMALNDHYLKYAHPSWVTGKLSDFLGVFYFPLFLAALWCLISRTQLSKKIMMVAMALTAIGFASIKVDVTLTNAIQNEFSRLFFNVRLTNDPTDLIALLSLLATYTFARRFINRPIAESLEEAQ